VLFSLAFLADDHADEPSTTLTEPVHMAVFEVHIYLVEEKIEVKLARIMGEQIDVAELGGEHELEELVYSMKNPELTVVVETDGIGLNPVQCLDVEGGEPARALSPLEGS
jgi:hypothetical protein